MADNTTVHRPCGLSKLPVFLLGFTLFNPTYELHVVLPNLRAEQLLASWHRTSGGFPANQINAIAPGTSNSIWLATDQGLINFRDGTVLNHFTLGNSSLPAKYIPTVTADDKGGI